MSSIFNWDLKMQAIFSQMESLSELARNVGDVELAAGLAVLLAASLDRYCRSKRERLETSVKSPPVPKPERRRSAKA